MSGRLGWDLYVCLLLHMLLREAVGRSILTVLDQFDTLEWSLEPEGGQKVSLLQSPQGDPFQQETADKIAVTA